MKIRNLVLLMFVFAAVAVPSHLSLAASGQTGPLGQYIADLQKNPNDNELREKIIKYVKTMKVAPAIPREVDELIGKAKYAFRHAKEQKDYLDAADAYNRVLLLAPWVGDYYYNLAVAQEQGGRPQDAISNFNLYLVASPYAKDAKDVRERIGGLKYAIEKGARDRQAAEAKAKVDEQREAPKKLLSRLKSQYNGATFRMLQCSQASESVCFNRVGYFPCGCNETEYKSSNWYPANSMFQYYVTFPSDGTIVFRQKSSLFGDSPFLIGTPKGPNSEDISWKASSLTVVPQWEAVWIKTTGGLDTITFSPQRGAEQKRPVEESRYNRNSRYSYNQLIRN